MMMVVYFNESERMGNSLLEIIFYEPCHKLFKGNKYFSLKSHKLTKLLHLSEATRKDTKKKPI